MPTATGLNLCSTRIPGATRAKKSAVLIASDLQKLGMKVIFQPIEFNTLITKIDDTCDYDCILLGLQPGIGTAGDPSDSMNVLKSDGFTHQWFPRAKDALDRLGSAH